MRFSATFNYSAVTTFTENKSLKDEDFNRSDYFGFTFELFGKK